MSVASTWWGDVITDRAIGSSQPEIIKQDNGVPRKSKLEFEIRSGALARM